MASTDAVEERARIGRSLQQIAVLQQQVESGDLVTRTGNDFTSESIRSLNQRDKTYSHCGIAAIENDSVFVYHAIGGDFNPDQKLKRDAFSEFADPYNNRGIGLFRYNLQPTQLSEVLATVKKWYRAGIMFDMDFDLSTDDRMYCAEFVSKSFSTGTHQLIRFDSSRIKDFIFIGVDDLFLHPRCKKLHSILFK